MEEPGLKDVSFLSIIVAANKLHDDYIYDEKVMRGHTASKAQVSKENSANIVGHNGS